MEITGTEVRETRFLVDRLAEESVAVAIQEGAKALRARNPELATLLYEHADDTLRSHMLPGSTHGRH